MPYKCACGCGLPVAVVDFYRKDCRAREVDAERPCPHNKYSAASKIYDGNRNPKTISKNNLRNNLKNNPKNNPKNSWKRKIALRDANLQAVIDDPTISTTQKMSNGTSAAMSVLTDANWADLQA